MQDLGRNRTFNGSIDGNINKLINSECNAGLSCKLYHQGWNNEL